MDRSESKSIPPVEAKYSSDESKFSLSAPETCFSTELKFTSNEQPKLSTIISKFSSTLVESYHKLFVLENAVRDQEMKIMRLNFSLRSASMNTFPSNSYAILGLGVLTIAVLRVPNFECYICLLASVMETIQTV